MFLRVYIWFWPGAITGGGQGKPPAGNKFKEEQLKTRTLDTSHPETGGYVYIYI